MATVGRKLVYRSPHEAYRETLIDELKNLAEERDRITERLKQITEREQNLNASIKALIPLIEKDAARDDEFLQSSLTDLCRNMLQQQPLVWLTATQVRSRLKLAGFDMS